APGPGGRVAGSVGPARVRPRRAGPGRPDATPAHGVVPELRSSGPRPRPSRPNRLAGGGAASASLCLWRCRPPMDLNRLTQKSQEALHDAQTKALRFGHTEVDGEHLLLALIDQPEGLVPRLLSQAGADPTRLKPEV